MVGMVSMQVALVREKEHFLFPVAKGIWDWTTPDQNFPAEIELLGSSCNGGLHVRALSLVDRVYKRPQEYQVRLKSIEYLHLTEWGENSVCVYNIRIESVIEGPCNRDSKD